MLIFKIVITVLFLIALPVYFYNKDNFIYYITIVSFALMALMWYDQIIANTYDKEMQKSVDIKKIMNAAFAISTKAQGIGFAPDDVTFRPDFNKKINELDEIDALLNAQLDNDALKRDKESLEKWQSAIDTIRSLTIRNNFRITDMKIKKEMGIYVPESESGYIKYHNEFYIGLMKVGSTVFEVYRKLADIKLPAK